MNEFNQQEADLLGAIAAAADAESLEAIRISALGKSGTITALLKTLGGMSPDERQARAPAIQALRAAVADAIAGRKAALDGAALEAKLAAETIEIAAASHVFDSAQPHAFVNAATQPVRFFRCTAW